MGPFCITLIRNLWTALNLAHIILKNYFHVAMMEHFVVDILKKKFLKM